MRGLITLLALLLSVVTTRAASVQAQLIRASDETMASDRKLQDLEPKLHKVFGFHHYQQLGSRAGSLQDRHSLNLDLGQGFVVFIKPRAAHDKMSELEVEWYCGRAAISKQTLKFPIHRPLFIKGPEVGKDWIVLALIVND